MEPEVNQRSLQLRMPNVVRQSDELTNYSAPDVQQCNKTPLVSIPTQTKVSAFWENVANSEMLTQKNDIENKGSLDDTRDIDFNLSSSEPITDTIIARPQMDGLFYKNDNIPLPVVSEVNPRTMAICHTYTQGLSSFQSIANDKITRGPIPEAGASSESFTRNNAIGIPGCMGNTTDIYCVKHSNESTTDTCIGRHSHISQEFDCDEDAIVPIEPKINPRSQHLQLIDVERHSKICMNHLETEVQQCNNRFHNLFPTENETQHFRDSCLHVGRSFQNQDRATVSRGTFSEDAATPDVDEFPNSSTTDHISMYGNVVTVYGSAPVSESSCWFGKPRYEVRLSETVRPIDEYNSLMWDDSVENDDAPMSGQLLANSE